VLFLMQADPTGLSTPLGQAVIAAGLLAAVVLAIRFLWEHRNRR
jgi:hypothetical protein